MARRILESDWEDYDNPKIRDGRDARFFACTERWEVEYLIKKINKLYPEYSTEKIRAAITMCCTLLKAPYPRRDFVECVMNRLRR